MRLIVLAGMLSLFFNKLSFGLNYVVEIETKNREERSKLAQIIHIDGFTNNSIFSVLNNHDFNLVQKEYKTKIISAEIVSDEKVNNYYAPFVSGAQFPDGDEDFHTYEELTRVLENLAQKYSDLVELFSLGQSVEGREIWALKISKNFPDSETQEKPGIVFMGTHHAREHVSTEVPLYFAEDILKQGLVDSEIQDLLAKINIYFIPMVNPDGAMFDISGAEYKYWRKNRSHNHDGSFGVDLNRNYGWGWGTGGSSSRPGSDIYMGIKPFSEPETQHIRDFFAGLSNITLAVSFHTYSELILYPWGGKDSGVGGEDELLFKNMAQDMAKMNGYEPMQSSGLYIASGDTCDYLYGEYGIFCFTFELSPKSWWQGGFYPGASILDQVYSENFDPMMYLLYKTHNL